MKKIVYIIIIGILLGFFVITSLLIIHGINVLRDAVYELIKLMEELLP